MSDHYALIGQPLRFSLSPAILVAAFRALGLDADYVLRPTPAAALPAELDALRDGRFCGANVTVPHKRAALNLAEAAGDMAVGLGAANTLVREPDGSLRAENTDAAGFAAQLAGLGLAAGAGRRALVLGAGGAARAVAYALLEAGYKVTVAARSSAQSAVLAATLNRLQGGADLSTAWLQPEHLAIALAGADLLVNTIPEGAADHEDDKPLPHGLPFGDRLNAVIDIVAWPLETALVRRARAEGRLAAGGLDMLLGQAAASFHLWTDRPAPHEIMRQAALEAAARRAAAEAGT